MATIDELLREARTALAATSFRPSPREAQLLLGHVLGLAEASVLAHGEQPVERDAAQRFRALLARRLAAEPVAYLVGEREFYGRPFFVDARVLVPRPETEHLVEAALALELPPTPRILDLGTGSGCIAVTLALEIPRARVVAGDLSMGALQVARKNAGRHGVGGRVAAVQADLASALRLERFDLVVSNPPYVSGAEMASLSPEVRDHEPRLALVAADHGRSLLARLLASAAALRPGVRLLLEIGYDQADWLRAQASVSPAVALLEIVRDYGGVARTAVLRRR